MRRHSRGLSSQMAAKNLKHERAEEFLKSHSNKLEVAFNNIKINTLRAEATFSRYELACEK